MKGLCNSVWAAHICRAQCPFVPLPLCSLPHCRLYPWARGSLLWR